MAEIKQLKFSFAGIYWETEPLKCAGGDIRVRLHKKTLFPVDLLVSIDGEEDYLKHDDFGVDEYKCELTLEGVMEGQYIKFRSRSEFFMVKIMEG